MRIVLAIRSGRVAATELLCNRRPSARLRGVRGYDYASYRSGETTRVGGDVVTPFQANVPVVPRGVAVILGQYVDADSAGAVVIPDDEVEPVLEEARKIEEEDAEYRLEISREGPLGEQRRGVGSTPQHP